MAPAPAQLRISRLATAVAVLTVVAWTLIPGPPTAAQEDGEDGSIGLVKDDELISNGEIAVRLSEITPTEGVVRVVISRDDDFPDALASGLLQADGRLLLVPPAGPLPPRVVDEMARLDVDEAVILGGDSAVSRDVEADLRARGMDVSRLSGPSRFETAVEIARDGAPEATTVLLARAFGSNPADPSQAFADALGGGGLAAEQQMPILLTATGQLPAPTRDYLVESGVEEVLLLGGTAAISAGVEQELQALGITTERVAGGSRAETAVEIARTRGADSAADAARVILVDGTAAQGFAAGFAAAGHSAATGAPILLTDGVILPSVTQTFLDGGDETSITCVVHPLACDQGRRALGLLDVLLFDTVPRLGSRVVAGDEVTLSLTPADEGSNVDVHISGSCLDESVTVQTDQSAAVTIALSEELPAEGACSFAAAPRGEGGSAFFYVLDPGPPISPGVTISASPSAFGDAVASTPLYIGLSGRCDDDDTEFHSSAFQARYTDPAGVVQGGAAFLSAPFEERATTAACAIEATVPPGVGRIFWGLYHWTDVGLRLPYALGHGSVAEFDLGALDVPETDLNVVFAIETPEESIGVAEPPNTGQNGWLYVNLDIDVECGGDIVPSEVFANVDPDVECTASSELGEVLVVAPGLPLVSDEVVEFTTSELDDFLVDVLVAETAD